MTFTTYPGVEAIALQLLETNFAGTVLATKLDEDGDFEAGLLIDKDNHTFIEQNLPEPDVLVDNGLSKVKKYCLDGVTLFIESGENESLSFWPANARLIDYFAHWNFDDIDWAEGVAEFGVDPELDEASDDCIEVRIWQSYHYYQGTLGKPRDRFVRDDDDNILVFPTFSDAQAWIDEATKGAYLLAHGEYARPDYLIVE